MYDAICTVDWGWPNAAADCSGLMTVYKHAWYSKGQFICMCLLIRHAMRYEFIKSILRYKFEYDLTCFIQMKVQISMIYIAITSYYFIKRITLRYIQSQLKNIKSVCDVTI